MLGLCELKYSHRVDWHTCLCSVELVFVMSSFPCDCFLGLCEVMDMVVYLIPYGYFWYPSLWYINSQLWRGMLTVVGHSGNLKPHVCILIFQLEILWRSIDSDGDIVCWIWVRKTVEMGTVISLHLCKKEDLSNSELLNDRGDLSWWLHCLKMLCSLVPHTEAVSKHRAAVICPHSFLGPSTETHIEKDAHQTCSCLLKHSERL